MFESIYQGVMRFSRRREAPYYLSLLSFVESFILPFPPPDVMLAPMSLAQPSRSADRILILFPRTMQSNLTECRRQLQMHRPISSR